MEMIFSNCQETPIKRRILFYTCYTYEKLIMPLFITFAHRFFTSTKYVITYKTHKTHLHVFWIIFSFNICTAWPPFKQTYFQWGFYYLVVEKSTGPKFYKIVIIFLSYLMLSNACKRLLTVILYLTIYIHEREIWKVLLDEHSNIPFGKLLEQVHSCNVHAVNLFIYL